MRKEIFCRTKKALKSDSAEKWIDAMQEKIQIENENETWFLVSVRYAKKIVPRYWVFGIKRNEDGVAEKYKDRFVAEGFAHTGGVDFGEKIAPTSRPEVFRLVLALAVQQNLRLEQLDMKSAFLHAKLKEEALIEQPENFSKVVEDGTKLVLKLNKSKYRLKQASKNWYDCLKTFLLDKSLHQNKGEIFFSLNVRTVV